MAKLPSVMQTETEEEPQHLYFLLLKILRSKPEFCHRDRKKIMGILKKGTP